MNRPITAHSSASHDTHAWTVTRRSNIERAFRRARRHSSRVRFLRFAIPIAVLIGVGVIVLTTWLNPLRAIANMPTASGGKLGVAGSKITMELPRLAGFTKDQRSYEVSAKNAVQDLKEPETIELHDIKAKMDFQDRSGIEMIAVYGRYNTKHELLLLTDKITLTSSKGYQGLLTHAMIEMRKGSITSDKPVTITMPNGKLESKTLLVQESGDVIRFDGGVVLDLEGSAVAAVGGTTEGRQ